MVVGAVWMAAERLEVSVASILGFVLELVDLFVAYLFSLLVDAAYLKSINHAKSRTFITKKAVVHLQVRTKWNLKKKSQKNFFT